MIRFVVRRLVFTVTVLVAVSFVTFCAAGVSLDPGYNLLASGDTAGHAFLVQHYHLDDPILSRYWRWLSGVPRHGFGTMMSVSVGGDPPRLLADGAPIWPLVRTALEVSIVLVGLSLVLVVLLSSAVGSVATAKRRFRVDLGARWFAYFGVGVPTFLVADLIRHAILPKSTVVLQQGVYVPQTHDTSWFRVGPPGLGGGIDEWARHLTLPVFALAIGLIGIYARYVRSAMLIELSQPYVVVARAKGLSEVRVLIRHALRNSVAPFAALLAVDMGGVIGASIAVDGVFGSGGLASAFVNGVNASDPNLLTAVFTATALLVCLFSFVADGLLIFLDPRLRSD